MKIKLKNFGNFREKIKVLKILRFYTKQESLKEARKLVERLYNGETIEVDTKENLSEDPIEFLKSRGFEVFHNHLPEELFQL